MKRTLLVAGLLAASVSQAVSKKPSASQDYLAENTGAKQESLVTACLKVEPYSISMVGPHGPATSQPMGLIVDTEANGYEVLDLPSRETGDCETGYIKIQTTAKLMALRHAPIGL